MDVRRRFPSVFYLEAAARRRMPRFCWEYLTGGAGRGMAVARNREMLDRVRFVPRYLGDAADRPELSTSLLGRHWDVPFGIAPIGLGGLVWPRAAEHLAATARRHNLPFLLGSYGTVSLERIAGIAPEHAWFQHYPFNVPEIDLDLVRRAEQAGFGVLVLTVDIPTATRRPHDVRNGLAVPPRMNVENMLQMMAKPQWALAMLASGVPRFESLLPYVPKGLDMAGLGTWLAERHEGHTTLKHLATLRDAWPRKLVVKGLYHPADVEDCRRLGIDGVAISNHGGRNVEGVPTAIEMLPEIRKVSGEMAVIADGGVRTGLDVARLIASGAGFVLAGRAFMFGVAAMGAGGGDRVAEILKHELHQTMAHIGCPTLADLPRALHGAEALDADTA